MHQDNIIAAGNRAFFENVMPLELLNAVFEPTIRLAQQTSRIKYRSNCCGYDSVMMVKAVDLKGETFLLNLHTAIEAFAALLPRLIMGELNDRIRTNLGLYRFEMDVTNTWLRPVLDLAEMFGKLPVGAELGREIEFRISFAV